MAKEKPTSKKAAKAKPTKATAKAAPKAAKGKKTAPAGGDKKKSKGGLKWQLLLFGVGVVLLGVAAVFIFMGGDDTSKGTTQVASNNPRPNPPPRQNPVPLPAADTTPKPAEDDVEEDDEGSAKKDSPPKGRFGIPVRNLDEADGKKNPAPPPQPSVAKIDPPMPAEDKNPAPPPAATTPPEPDSPAIAMVKKLDDPAQVEAAKKEIMDALTQKKDEREEILSALGRKAANVKTGGTAYALLNEAAQSMDKELQDAVAKRMEEVNKQRAENANAGLRDDPTNMLPNSTKVVLSIPTRKFMGTSLSNAVFRTRGAFRPEDFKNRLGIDLSNIEQLVMGGNNEHGYSFVAVKTFGPYDWETVKRTMQIRPEFSKIIDRKQYHVGKVDFLVELFGNLVPITTLREKAAVHRKDDRTLVYGDVKSIEEFLANPPKFNAEAKVELEDPGLLITPGQSGRRRAPARPGVPTAGGRPNPNAPPPPAQRKGPTRYLTLDPDLRVLIEKAEGEREAIFLFAEEYNRAADKASARNLVSFMPYLEKSFGLTSALALAWNEERPTKLTLAARCGSKLIAQALQPQLESQLKAAARRDLKQAFGFDFLVRGSQDDGLAAANTGTNSTGRGRPPSGARPSLPGRGRPGGSPNSRFPSRRGPNQPSNGQDDDSDKSKIEIQRRDEFITVTAEMKESTDDFVENNIAPQMAFLRGQMEMNGGQLRLRELLNSLPGYSGENAGQLPLGALPRETTRSRGMRPWQPSERVSWMASMLPYLGDDRYVELHGAINPARSWRDPANLRAGRVLVSHFLNPGSGRYYVNLGSVGQPVATTHFVGMAGVGPDAAYYPKTDKRAGIFGYDRQAKTADIKDGISNTIFMIETDSAVAGPWIAGGGATIRGTSEAGDRDVGHPGGFRSPTFNGKEGVWIMMADGSARFLSKSVSPQVFKDLCTMAGGERISDLHIHGPKVMEHSTVAPLSLK